MFKSDLLEQLNSSEFRVKVNSLIQESEFYKSQINNLREYINSLHIDQKIKDEVNSQTRNITQTFENHKLSLKREISDALPGQVALQLSTQVPTFLNNNAVMLKILEDHKNNIIDVLNEHVKTILNQIVSDPSYHTINAAYFNAFESKGDVQINEFIKNSKQSIDDSKKRVDEIIASLKQDLQKLAQLDLKLTNQQKEIDKQNTWQTINICTIIGLIGCVTYLFITKN